MALNEYSIVKGGTIFDRADIYAQRWAKFFLTNRGIDINNLAVITKGADIKFRHPIEDFNKVKVELEGVRYDKNRNICVFVKIVDHKLNKIADLIHFTFATVPLEELKTRAVGLKKK